MRTRRPRHAKAHDLRGQYASLPAGPDLATAIIEDPYGPPADAPATRDRGEWSPAARPRIVVVRTFRHDPLGRMHARGHVTESEYLAGRAYQTMAETAAGRSTTQSSLWDGANGGAAPGRSPVPINDAMIRATRRLRTVDTRVQARYGAEGLSVTRAVLLQQKDLQHLSGDRTAKQFRFFGLLLRHCLDEIAIMLGLASRGA